MTHTAVVTGVGSSLGASLVRKLVKEGYKVGMFARSTAYTRSLEQELNSKETVVKGLATDISDEGQVQRSFQQIRETFGPIDLLINHAGNAAWKEFMALTPEDFEQSWRVCAFGSFLCTQEAFRIMKAQEPQGGRIINNGSISAAVPRPGSTPYTSSKHAITGMTRSISLDGRPFNIACGQIDIGNAASDMTSQMTGGVPQADGSTKSEPVMDVDNVAKAVLHMADLPLEANVQFMTIMATAMPFIGRG